MEIKLKKTLYTIRVSHTLRRDLRVLAAQRGETLSQLLAFLVEMEKKTRGETPRVEFTAG